jgi:hypothetical protein
MQAVAMVSGRSVSLAHGVAQTRCYSILGVPVAVTSDVAPALDRVEDTYAAFRCRPGGHGGGDSVRLDLYALSDGTRFVVSGGIDRDAIWERRDWAIIDLLGRLVAALMPRLHTRGLTAIHAGAVVHRSRAIIVCGRSGQGKTTLVLGLLARGLGLLSDEFAVLSPDAALIAPYRRGVHIRPGTPELISPLAFLRGRPRHELGGGIEWALTPAELEGVFPGCLAPAAPLGHVLLLDGEPCAAREPAITPVPAVLAAMELLRGTWCASVDFEGTLRRVGTALAGARCARLRSGDLDATVESVMSWVEETGA